MDAHELPRTSQHHSQFQSLYSVTCFVSIYKRFARPSQCLFLCTSLSCRALQSSTRLRRGASATRHQPVSQLPSGTLAALQVFAGEIRASANSSSSDLGVLRTRTSAALVARLFGRRQRHQPTSRLPSRTLAVLHVLAGGRFVHRRTRARRICPCSPRRGLLGRRLRHQSPSLSLAMVSESRNMQH